MAAIPDVADLAVWVDIRNANEAQTSRLTEALEASVEDILERCTDDTVTPGAGSPAVDSIPSVVRLAILLWGSRLYKRSTSPEGVAGFGDLGVVRVVGLDPDIESMLSLHLKMGGFI